MKVSEQVPGYVYVLRDRLNNNLIKVGLSKHPIKRVQQLYSTATPLPMAPYCIWHVNNMGLAEAIAHEVLKDHRINPRREFFEIAPAYDFDEFETTDYEITSGFLDTLLDLIEDGMDYMNESYHRINSLDEIL